MKLLAQSLNNKGTILVECDIPKASKGTVLIQSISSLISTGTEKMLADFGSAGYLSKVKQQPDKVNQVIQKIQTDGLIPTLEAVNAKLNMPISLGYCNVGKVVSVGEDVIEFKKGDIVVSNGGHAEYTLVPKNLCAKVPEGVNLDDAVFTVLSSIALQGIRLINPTLGETITVMGLGLVGQLTVDLLKANGCKVIAMDIDKDRVSSSNKLGVEGVHLSKDINLPNEVDQLTKGKGVDGVLITANSTSDLIIKQAANISRKRGRIVLVGVSGLNISRDDFYEKELTFQVSCSYGPGRYEPEYEEGGLDYPIGFVRWTEQRNFEAILDLMKQGSFNPSRLITKRFKLHDSTTEYDASIQSKDNLGILIDYPKSEIDPDYANDNSNEGTEFSLPIDHSLSPVIGLIGSGEYGRRVLIPILKKQKADLRIISSQMGLSGVFTAKDNNIKESTTDYKKILNSRAINTVIVSTRHDTHASIVGEALENGKNVFVEKPLCIKRDELDHLKTLYSELSKKKSLPRLMVGFNRRFSPHVEKVVELLAASKSPSSCIITVNAGKVPNEHWIHNRKIGGGRIIGEACHFIDLLFYLLGGDVIDLNHSQMKGKGDSLTINMKFKNGSIGTIHYFANGNKNFAKERVEIFNSGSIYTIDNFRNLNIHYQSSTRKNKSFTQDKGQKNCIKYFLEAITSQTPMPIPIEEIFTVTDLTLQIAEECGYS